MRLRNAQGLPVPGQINESESFLAEAAEAVANNSDESRTAKPFIERRRRTPLDHAWPEALDVLHRHLVSYEIVQQRLLESESKYRSIYESAPIGIFQVLADGQPLNLNPEMARILGFESAEQYLKAAENDPSLRFCDPGRWNQANCSAGESGDPGGVDIEIRCADSSMRWIRIHLRALYDDEGAALFEGTAEDVTDRKRIEIRTETLAYYDSLTGLPNRTLFHDRLSGIVSGLNQTNDRLALLLVEFDSYKAINESLGGPFSDTLLQEIGKRIRAEVGEKVIVARLEGAEFGIILQNCGSIGHVASVATSILASLGTDYSLMGHTLNIFFSMGISLFPANGETFEDLLKNAEAAKSCARDEGSSNFRFFTEEMNGLVQERMMMESGLRMALAKKEFYLEYQPQVDIRTGAVVGLEALLRWKSPQLGLVPPTRFIEIAEKSSLIVPIGEWVLQEACSQARGWQDKGLPPVPIAVNVSPVQFRQQNFCEVVQRSLRQTGLNPECLELELTESLLMSNADLTSSTISELRAMGVMLAIDDFGTGYSSLGYLRQFKVNRLKIARNFVQEVSTDPDDAAITIAIIEMARAMNLSVLAEGVENEEQLLFLREQNCQTIQGFYFSKPVPATAVDRQLRTGFSELIPAPAAWSN